MFRRKRPEGETDKSVPDALEDLELPVKPGARPAPAAAAVPLRPPVIAPRAPTEAMRPITEPRRADVMPPPSAMPVPAPAPAPSPGLPQRREAEMRKLIVGREISLAGEITSCDRLVVEGSVEANLNNCREVEIAETGLLKGTAAIEEAEVRGRFEGNLTVRKRLHIRATGKVIGTVRYGQLEIECGGQISGDVQSQPFSDAGEPPLTAPRPTILSLADEAKAS